MATVNSTLHLRRSGPHGPGAIGVPRHFSRIFRAHLTPASDYGTERTAYVEAFSHRDAVRKIVNAIAALESRLPDEVQERIYNVASAQELIDEGVSQDLELRLFETGWCGGKAICFVREPLFLVGAPDLIRKWAQISSVGHVGKSAQVQS